LRYFCWFIGFLFCPFLAFSQGTNIREKTILRTTDTLHLDTLNIVPNSVFLYDKKGNIIDRNQYTINPIRSWLLFSKDTTIPQNDTLKISYRVFSFQLNTNYFHKDIRRIERGWNRLSDPYSYTLEKPQTDVFKYEGLNKNGSISRGVSFGNNQDLVLNSSLNLQLSGKLNEKVSILAAITDQNIPIQPDGNTQQIQDFDKVYIRVFSDRHKLTAGDFELTRPESYFMNFYKKAQGGSYTGYFDIGQTLDKKPKGIMRVSTSAAISRGKYAKNVIQGIEGNQGPYRLKGNNNEPFIIVIAGTERIYLNGMLLERGQQADYVIDYNTAELRFNPKRLITKDSRIVAEIAYSDKNYARSLFYFNNEYETGKIKVKFNMFSEQDSKNQPVLQSLTDQQKILLQDIGDSIQNAIYPSVDSIPFDVNQILYRKVDSLGFRPVYVYSTNPSQAHFRLAFSNVGEGNGDYRQISTAANGKVFRWFAPVNGVRQGNYAPLIQLVTPKMQQLYTLGADYQLSAATKLSVEGGLSNNDINLFSDKQKANDVGKAIKLDLKNTLPINSEQNWKINTNINFERLDNRFIPIERYRAVEFERDWNLPVTKVNENTLAQTASIVTINAANKYNNNIGYNFKTYSKGAIYAGYQHGLNSVYRWRSFSVLFDANLLQSQSTLNKTNYFKQKADISKRFNFITIGAREEQERNSFLLPKKDSLLFSPSFAFNQYSAYISNRDSSRNKYRLEYISRTDYKPSSNNFKKSTLGESINLTTDLTLNPTNHFIGSITYRKLTISDSLLTNLKPENSLLSRLEYNFSLFKGGFISSTFYEIGTGQELKKEFSFLEVAAGKGSYGWFDYNKNGIKELNEFELIDASAFPDLAKYVKVFTPTSLYIKAHNNQFNQVLTFNPDKIIKDNTFTGNLIGRFSNQVSLRLDRKTVKDDLLQSLNLFQNNTADSNLVTVNSYLRNTLFFNRSNPVFGADYNYQNIKNKTLLTNGFESREQKEHKTNFRLNITRYYTLNLLYTMASKNNRSDFFSTRDFAIHSREIEPKITFQPGSAYRISVLYRWLTKVNGLKGGGGENSDSRKIGAELKINSVTQGSIDFKVNYILIQYTGETNSSLAYEMLEGLKVGKNINWSVSLQRNLSNRMQLSLNYEGRKSEDANSIHTGGVQVRAYF
jgi:hypothetical protein